jgi:hypothetical protein
LTASRRASAGCRSRHGSIRYRQERVWVERWLHMIARSMIMQPASTEAVVAMVQGHGELTASDSPAGMRSSTVLRNPPSTVLPLTDLADPIAEARAAVMPASLNRTIAQIRARATGTA